MEKDLGMEREAVVKSGQRDPNKTVSQAIPLYAMSFFDPTKSLCDEINTMMCCYWWSQQDKENKMHWLSCDTLCNHKEEGGLGFRDLHLFDVAVLARQTWRLLAASESLCAQVLRAKCFNIGDLLSVKEDPYSKWNQST